MLWLPLDVLSLFLFPLSFVLLLLPVPLEEAKSGVKNCDDTFNLLVGWNDGTKWESITDFYCPSSAIHKERMYIHEALFFSRTQLVVLTLFSSSCLHSPFFLSQWTMIMAAMSILHRHSHSLKCCRIFFSKHDAVFFCVLPN